MPNLPKEQLLQTMRERFGELRKLPNSQSLFTLGDTGVRLYIRYSKLHGKGRTFFGLRDVDLRQLEGHRSYLCLLVDKELPAVFIPYVDFEEIFHGAQSAKDGQYKAQLTSARGQLELYVARQGRFNVEGYVGLEALERDVTRGGAKHIPELTHSQVQTLLAGIGNLKGYEVFVPPSDVGRLDWSLSRKFPIAKEVPKGFRDVSSILGEIDVIWVASGRATIEGLFEVEHTTSIYSGLLRFNDVLLTNPTVSRFSIVSEESRRSVFSRQLFRPTFRKSGLSELTTFMEYANVVDWHERLNK